MRLFVGIDCSRKCRQIIGNFQRTFSQSIVGSFIQNHHISMKFLGEVDETELMEIDLKLNSIKLPMITVQLSEFGVFGNSSSPSILYAGLESAGLMMLQAQIEELLGARFPSDYAQYVPHITMVRIASIKDEELFKVHRSLDLPQFRFDVYEFHLYKSELTPDGSVYDKLHTYSLEQPTKKLQQNYELPPLN
jgi:RNA 2',3'-cyclic 3'-phosphodiesterase